MSARTQGETSTLRLDRIEAALREAFHPAHLEIEDESDRHRGHPGAASGGGHFRVRLVCADFEAHARASRHRMVYKALEGLVGSEIHAITLELLTPEEWQERTWRARTKPNTPDASHAYQPLYAAGCLLIRLACTTAASTRRSNLKAT